MWLKRYTDIADYYARVEPFLMRHEAAHCLLLGICSTLLHQPETEHADVYMATVEREGEVVLAAMRTLPFHPVLSLPAEDAHTAETLAPLIQDLRAVYGQLSGIHGPAALSWAFAEQWHGTTGQDFHPFQRERIYQLETVIPVAGVPGSTRRATPDDRGVIERWLAAFNDEALPASAPRDDPAEWVSRLFTTPSRAAYLWVDNGAPVSLAGYGNPTPNGMRIGPVYTPPERRGRGYASACVAAMSQLLLDAGRRFCFLFTDLANPTSNAIYQRIGYRPVCDVDVYEFAKE
ncbi:MAG TPA: GNAT family N-acetyltransferase [Ktedonobacterales bacterium]|nr:GNAT family N-acetyltransferase [Ktedonobacterales bacterium]